jgi:signal transduction histidine kinase
MREDVPLAAPDLGQERPTERERPEPGPATGLSEPAWEVFYGLVLVASTVLVEAEPLDPARRVAATVALAAMIPWYLVLARPLMRLEDAKTWQLAAASWRGPVYLTGVTALLAVALYANPNAWFLAFALCPQCFQLNASLRRAMGFVIAFNCVAGLTTVLDSRTAESVASAAGIVLFAIAFSWVFSRWTARVIEQSYERGELIAQLEAAQAELGAVSHEAGVLAERQRLATEIHDTLAQGFLSIVTLVQAAQAAEPAGAVAEHLELALATARDNLAEARTLVTALAPASLDDGGLPGALARAARASGQAAGFEPCCAAEGPVRPLPTSTEVVLLRVCQESLANVSKHAAATRVDVRLRYAAAAVELSVTDDGRGFLPAPEGPPGTAFGLRGMRERLRQAGGTLTVTTAPGRGTTVRAEIPG